MIVLFLDTNILLRLFDAAAPEHGIVRHAVEILEARGEAPVIGLQVLVEAWVVATRPVERNGLGWPTEAAKTLVDAARSRFGMLVEDEAAVDRWAQIVAADSVKGKRAHDARIVGAHGGARSYPDSDAQWQRLRWHYRSRRPRAASRGGLMHPSATAN